ncbi:hypothetical protein AZI86_16185 [Bdellovibrio bacteriovorus]|uniref:Pyrrolo-quinoline quinone repeat domain-containing protein n=1 Tax=Bdellovibrio bacteriovorus TaxID=959 RepID=A0A150WH24_BDEBC|nr:PQQ-binding-like beta-propeller repeat protein [Bdellovibrio bacteriovorus]KYG62375.1 hypothetical protein AZI86_16185 [Bdellovibrio bacteriovorus]
MLRFFSIYGFFVLASSFGLLVLSGNQGATWWTERPYFQQIPQVGPSVILKKLNPDVAAPKTFYRHNVQRTGFFDLEISTSLKLRKLNDATNISVHQASKSSPLVLDDQVVIATDAGLLRSVDLQGNVKWNLRNFTSAYGFHGTPAAWGDLIIAGDYSGLMLGLDKNNGQLSWILQLGDTFGASPLITDDGYVLISVETNAPNGFIAKIEANTGKVIWRSAWLGDHSHSSPSLSAKEYQGTKIIVVGDNAGYVNGIRETDGKTAWRLYIGKPMKSTASIHNEIAYLSTWDSHVYALDVATGTVLWRKEIQIPNQSSIAITPDGKYGFINSSRGLCRFTLSPQQDLVCEEKEYTRGARKASPIITKDKGRKNKFLVWTGCDDTRLCVFDSETFKRIKTWDLPGRLSGEVVPHEGKVYLIPERGGTFVLESP